MIKKGKITSLHELRLRKKQVRMEAELAKREFAHSIGTTRGNATNYLLKKVAAPAGGAVVGLMVLNNLLRTGKSTPVVKETKVIHEYPDGSPFDGKRIRGRRRNRIKALTGLLTSVRILMPVIQAVIGAFQTHKAKEAAKQAKNAAYHK